MPHEDAKTLYYEVSEIIDQLTLVYNNQSTVSGNDLIKWMTTLLGYWQCDHHSFPVTSPSDVSYMMQCLGTSLQNSAQAKVGLAELDCADLMDGTIGQLMYLYAAYGFK